MLNFVQVYRIIIKVLSIKVLVEQVKEQRNLFRSLKPLKKMLLKKSAPEDVVIKSKDIRSISSEATSPEA